VIITRAHESFRLVRQVEHGRVAGELASHWGNATFESPTPRESVIFATTRHDEGWRAWDARGLLNEVERRPKHFLEIDPDEHVRLYREGVERVRLGDVYAGLLVGMHWTGLYRGRWSHPDVRGRLARDARDERVLDDVVDQEEHRWVETRRAAWTAEEPRAVFESTVWHNYELLQLWDLLSLYLCVMPQEPVVPGSTPKRWGPQLSALEHSPEAVVLPQVRTGVFGSTSALRATVVAWATVVVEPWPFKDSQFAIEVEHTLVPDKGYASSAEVGRALRVGKAESRRWTITRESTPSVKAAPFGRGGGGRVD
jgi:hypothetical protein